MKTCGESKQYGQPVVRVKIRIRVVYKFFTTLTFLKSSVRFDPSLPQTLDI